MKDYTHVLYFNGCPVFCGSLEECEAELSKRASSDKIRRFYNIRTKESVDETVAEKLLVDQSRAKVHSSPEYDKFGDVVYYSH
jgi:hypothetical protein